MKLCGACGKAIRAHKAVGDIYWRDRSGRVIARDNTARRKTYHLSCDPDLAT